jgi:hypothetical protein
MKRLRGSGDRDGAPRPNNAVHGGSGVPKGKVHEAPTRPAVNSANYAGQKLKRK